MAETNVNVQDILLEIQTEIKAKGYTNEILSFKEPLTALPMGRTADLGRISEKLAYLERHWYVNPLPPIEAQGGVKGRLVRFIKRIIRKCVRFYIVPAIECQNDVNRLNVECFGELRMYLKETQEIPDRYDELERIFTKEIKKPFAIIQDEAEQLQGLMREIDVKLSEMQDMTAKSRDAVEILQRKVEILELENKKLRLLADTQRGE